MEKIIEKERYMCTSEKDGLITDIRFVSTIASAHVYCALQHVKGHTCNVYDMSHMNRRVILKEEPEAPKKKPTTRWAKRVRCRETGQVWPTVSDFQHYIGIKRWALESRIRHNVPINGKTYEFFNEKE